MGSGNIPPPNPAGQVRYLPTVTTLSVADDGSIAIRSSYLADVLPNVIAARIATGPGRQDGVSFVQGDLLLQLKNYPSQIDFVLDPATGNLIVTGPDAAKYSIVEGQLLYTE